MIRHYRFLFVFLAIPLVATAFAADPVTIPLRRDGAPGSQHRASEPEKVDREKGRHNVSNVHQPSITAYLPKDDVATGTAIFIALGAKDRPDISLGMANLYLKYKEANVPCELHIYSNAGHGFGDRPGTTTAAGDWPLRLTEWLIDSNLLTR